MKMKRLTRWAAALGMTALLLCGSAFAAGEQTIAVQLNGEDLTFTDAVPQVKDQRTFLPFRAVFEAMGAEVSNEGNVIRQAGGQDPHHDHRGDCRHRHPVGNGGAHHHGRGPLCG